MTMGDTDKTVPAGKERKKGDRLFFQRRGEGEKKDKGGFVKGVGGKKIPNLEYVTHHCVEGRTTCLERGNEPLLIF